MSSESRPRGIGWLLTALFGAALMFTGFIAGLDAAFDGSGNGAGFWVVVFLIGLGSVLSALVGSIVWLARPGRKTLSWIALFVATLMLIGVVLLFLAPRLSAL